MVHFVTSNKHKVAEIQKMTSMLIEQKNLNYPEIQADTLESVAEFGIEFCYVTLGEPCFIEDSGLFVDALSGFPGVYSNYVYRTLGCEGILALLGKKRKATFKSVIAFKDERGTTLFSGEVKGEIAKALKGEKGFGFDPIFIPEGEEKTFAQMDPEEKNLYSHRARAFRTFVKHLDQVR